MRLHKAGAPKGGRVHWLLWNLKGEFKRAYRCYYNYAWHRYIFARYRGRDLYDVFIVYRTSEHYFICTYANVETNDFQRFGDITTKTIALRMWLIYKKYEKIPDKIAR